MKLQLVAASVLVVVIAGVLWLVMDSRRGSRSAAQAAPPVPAADSTHELAAVPEPLADAKPTSAPRPDAERTAVEPAQPVPAKVRTVALAELRGRFVFEGGAPAAGVQCEVHGWGANQERQLKYGMPKDWIDPSGESDTNGRISLEFDPPRAFQFTLEAKLPGYAGVEWRWSEIEPRAVVDLGEITLRRGGTLEGRIVDQAGRPLLGQDWLVYARSIEAGAGKGRDETQVIARVDPVTGGYRAEDVLPGKVDLKAYSHIANWIEGPPVTLASGETLTADIVYAGPDNSQRITVVTFSRPFYVMSNPDPQHIKLIRPNGTVCTAEKIEGSSQSFSFDDIEAGTYALEIDDPRYLPWSRAGVVPGERIDAHLKGSAALALNVLDAQGDALADYSARVEFRNVTFSPSEFEVEPVRGLLEGMFPGDYTIRVKAGEILGAVEVDGLAAGETRAVTMTLGTACAIAGRVMHADGSPVAGIEVLLLRPAEVDDSASSPIQTKHMTTTNQERFRKEVDSVVADEQGRFRFAVARAGSYVVYASADGSEANSEVLALTNAGLEDVKLVLPRGGRVRGTLRGPHGETFAGYRVALETEVPPEETSDESGFAHLLRMQRVLNTGGAIAEVRSDGRFELGPFPAGPATLYFLLPERQVRGERGITFGDSNSNRIELGKVTLEEAAVVDRDFEVLELPGTITLAVMVNGEPATGVWLQLQGEQGSGFDLSGETDTKGMFGPALAFAGTWTVSVSDSAEGWSHASPLPLVVTPSAETRSTIAITVATAKVLFLDRESGKPLGKRSIAVYEAEAPFPMAERETDSEGFASFTLTPGEYRFLLDPGEFPFVEPDSDRRTAVLQWTERGPQSERLEL